MTFRSTAVRDTYDGMAAVYDRFTAHHDYDAWTATLEALALRHGLDGDRLLDAGCGTGKSFLPFLRRGYDIVAFDVSPAMTALAAAKAPDARVLVHDVRELPRLGEFDLVCCLDDCLNYLIEPAELAGALTALAANLAPAGVLVFDLNTLATYRGFFAQLVVDPSPEEVLVWAGETSEAIAHADLASACFTTYRRGADGTWGAASVRHRQRHHPRADVESALAAAGLEAVGVYGLWLDGRTAADVDELAHTKAIYVARHTRTKGRR